MIATTDRSSALVLVVDDNEANRALAQDTLEGEGYDLVLASSGAEALAAFETYQPDCVVLDVRMPVMDGFVVCERIRALPGGVDTPVLFLTALRDIDTFDHALRAGGDDFLTKPVRPTELIVRVQSALKLRRIKFELRDHYELLKHQRDDLYRLQLQKERLMAFVVHDLKNPVNAMDLHAQLLLRDKDLPENSRDSAVQIRTAARQLTRMIVNLLDVSKADEGQLTPKRSNVDLRKMLEAIGAELGVSAKSRNVSLNCLIHVDFVSADEDLLRRVLINLIENGIRYAPQKSMVTVTAIRTEAAVEIRIADAGSGIPEAMREKVFSPFVQVESVTHEVARGSRGLGLTFCKHAIEAHGGSIGIEDAAPGAVFCVRLPDE